LRAQRGNLVENMAAMQVVHRSIRLALRRGCFVVPPRNDKVF